MIIWKGKLLIARSSTNILLFKQTYDEDLGRKRWSNFQTIPSKGFISSNRKINKFQVVEDMHIHFYSIDEDTL